MTRKPTMKPNEQDKADAKKLSTAFGNRVKQELVSKNMQLKTLADLMDTTPSHLSKLLGGQYNMTMFSMARIANALETQLEFTLDNTITRGAISLEVVNPDREILYRIISEDEDI